MVCKRIDVDGEDAEDAYNESGFEEIGIDPLTGELVDKPARVLHSVEEMSERLASPAAVYRHIRGNTTGRDDDATKAEVMERFSSGEAPLLVSTTVIEVGVDVPQAKLHYYFRCRYFPDYPSYTSYADVWDVAALNHGRFVHNAEPESIASERLAVIRDSSDGACYCTERLRIARWEMCSSQLRQVSPPPLSCSMW